MKKEVTVIKLRRRSSKVQECHLLTKLVSEQAQNLENNKKNIVQKSSFFIILFFSLFILFRYLFIYKKRKEKQ